MHGKLVIIRLNHAILRRTVCTDGFKGEMEGSNKEILKSQGTSKFTTLIGADATTILVAVMPKKFRDDI